MIWMNEMEADRMIAKITAEVQRKRQADDTIEAMIEECDTLDHEYIKKASKPIRYTPRMVEDEVRRALCTLGDLYIGYEDTLWKKFTRNFGHRPKFRIKDGYIHRYASSCHVDNAGEFVVGHGREVLPYIKNEEQRAAFEKFIEYMRSAREKFDYDGIDYPDEPKQRTSVNKLVVTDGYDGIETYEDVRYISIENYGDDSEPMVELWDSDEDSIDDLTLSVFTVAQLRPDLDALLEKRDALNARLRFIHELHDKIDELLAPWLALRAL